MKKRTLLSVVQCILAVTLLAGCNGADGVSTDGMTAGATDISIEQTQAEAQNTEQETQGDVKDPTVYYTNPLTGENTSLNDILFDRPVAVVLKNDRTGAPQLGIARADIVYEAAVEGGMTRLLALYADYSQISDIGPIIDSRTYFYEFAEFHDAVFVQAGTTAAGKAVQKEKKTDCIDAVAGMAEITFRRDEALASERDELSNILTSGAALKERIARDSIRQKNNNKTSLTVNFVKMGEKNQLDGNVCMTVTVPYSSSHKPYFVYSTVTGKYTRYQYGEKHLDNDGTELKYTNILILSTEYSVISEASGEMKSEFIGSGDGYYVTDGKYIPIVWKRDAEQTQITYCLKNGEELELNRGKTFVCAVPNTRFRDVKLEQ